MHTIHCPYSTGSLTYLKPMTKTAAKIGMRTSKAVPIGRRNWSAWVATGSNIHTAIIELAPPSYPPIRLFNACTGVKRTSMKNKSPGVVYLKNEVLPHEQ